MNESSDQQNQDTPHPTLPLKGGGKREVWWWVATWFGVGLSPMLSGTIGSLAALPFAYLIHVYFGSTVLFAAAFAMFFIGWWAAEQYVRATGIEDARPIVVDEVAGQWLLLSVLFPTWQSYLVAFILFRAFDIVKPWPVSLADRHVKGGLGVMLDDILAAAYPVALYVAIVWMAQLLHAQGQLLPIFSFLGGYVQ